MLSHYLNGLKIEFLKTHTDSVFSRIGMPDMSLYASSHALRMLNQSKLDKLKPLKTSDKTIMCSMLLLQKKPSQYKDIIDFSDPSKISCDFDINEITK